jgi:hypothetical protein
LYTVDLTTPVFFPSNFFHRDQGFSEIFTSQKEVKMPATREVIGSWLCFYVMIGLLRHHLQEHIFYVVSQEATTSRAYFLSYPKDMSN